MKQQLKTLTCIITLLASSCGRTTPVAKLSDTTARAADADKTWRGFFLRPVSVSAGGYQNCMVELGVNVKCWGKSNGAIEVPALIHPVQVSSGVAHACSLDRDGVKCWGHNGSGQTDVPALNHPVQVSSAFWRTCALDQDGVKCWGENYPGQTNVPALNHPVQVSSGLHHNCALDLGGVQCWGDNRYGQRNVPALNYPVEVSSGGHHTCALDQDGVKCWGDNREGQTKVPVFNHPVQVSSGFQHTCALDHDGVKCWGYNGNGETTVPALNRPVQVSSGYHQTCAVDEDGVKCWGYLGNLQPDVPDGLNFERTFAPWAKSLEFYSYKDRKVFFERMSKIQSRAIDHSVESQDEALLIFLIEGFVRLSTSEFFRDDVLPDLETAKRRIKQFQNITSSTDIPLTPERITIALQVLEAALSASRNLTTPDVDASVSELIAEVNSALAATPIQDSAVKILGRLFASQKLVSEYQSEERLLPYIAAFEDVAKFVQH